MQNSKQNYVSLESSFVGTDSFVANEDYLRFINFQNMCKSPSEDPLTAYPENSEMENDPLRLVQKSKRIMKREQAKKRTKEKVPIEEKSEDLDSLSEKDKKRMQQKIRNRMSAQQSRDRKKVYMVNLEQQNSVLISENTLLKQDIMFLKQENEQLKEENFYLKSQLHPENAETNESGVESESTNPNYLYEETTNNSDLSSPLHTGSPKKLFKYGLGLLSIVSLVMIFSMNGVTSETTPGLVSLYHEKPISTDVMLLQEEDPQNQEETTAVIELSQHPALKYLQNYRREIMNKILFGDEKPLEKKNSVIRMQKTKSKFLEDKNETQLVLFQENQEYPLSTLFCPKTYIYQSEVVF